MFTQTYFGILYFNPATYVFARPGMRIDILIGIFLENIEQHFLGETQLEQTTQLSVHGMPFFRTGGSGAPQRLTRSFLFSQKDDSLLKQSVRAPHILAGAFLFFKKRHFS